MFATPTKVRVLLALVIFLPLAQAAAQLSPRAESAIDAIAQQAIASGKSAGLVVAVAQKGRPVFHRGYGQANLEWQVQTTPDTVFRIGSITKQFAAASILLLAEQKKLSVDDKLSQFFPEFPRASEVSIRQLLTHTSGIHNYPGPAEETMSYVGVEVPDMVKHLGTLGYDFDPGTQWSYSNSGYFLVGAIIEKVSGQSFRDFAKQNLFDPCGMKQTAVDVNSEVVPKRASGYSPDSGNKGAFLHAAFTHMSLPHAAGAIRSTAGDLIKWTAALHGGRVLSAASYKEMTTPVKVSAQKESPNYGFGLGTAPLQGHAAFSHGGAIDGFQANLDYFVKEQLTIVVLVNTDGGAEGLSAAVAKALLE